MEVSEKFIQVTDKYRHADGCSRVPTGNVLKTEVSGVKC